MQKIKMKSALVIIILGIIYENSTEIMAITQT